MKTHYGSPFKATEFEKQNVEDKPDLVKLVQEKIRQAKEQNEREFAKVQKLEPDRSGYFGQASSDPASEPNSETVNSRESLLKMKQQLQKHIENDHESPLQKLIVSRDKNSQILESPSPTSSKRRQRPTQIEVPQSYHRLIKKSQSSSPRKDLSREEEEIHIQRLLQEQQIMYKGPPTSQIGKGIQNQAGDQRSVKQKKKGVIVGGGGMVA